MHSYSGRVDGVMWPIWAQFHLPAFEGIAGGAGCALAEGRFFNLCLKGLFLVTGARAILCRFLTK